ncbi:helix-turn-helix domain-containing protein [Aquimarina sp. D1M17]|uniref:helix-turn-helix domain-containing protein n=1 Tax=Aquimarina acroporae TaxID=2937283 RepID=UPI0020C06E8E|nr:helix-turn-helix domain-containing protein [Aquimarina acroporae]MCK8524131.1 helix-turn-helix domain-containing protein [Aquimarina acroporae]
MSNVLIIVSGIGAIQSTLFALLVSNKKQKQRSDWILISWFLTFSTHLSLGIIHTITPITFIDILIMTISFLHGPFFLIYTKSIIGSTITKKDIWHFIPFLLFTIAWVYVHDIHNTTWEIAILIPKLISLILYPLYIFFWFQKKIRFFKTKTADTTILEFLWIKTIALLFLISILLGLFRLSTELIVGVSYFELMDVLRYVLLVTVLGFYGLRYGMVYKPELYPIPSTEEKKYKNSPLQQEEITEFKERINHFFQQNDDYLDADFSLPVLSKSIQIPKHHLSQIINSEMNTTFYDLVNSKRVEYAIQRIKKQNELNITLEGLGYESGFNSKSAFFYHFKKHTGKTPGQFRKEISAD